MAKTYIASPNIIRVSYRQEQSDPDHGSCLWADFDFDTEQYTLKIMSDCGNYSYGWHPTPKVEAFLILCRRLDHGYLLNKLAKKTQLDYDATTGQMLQLFEDLADDIPHAERALWTTDIEAAVHTACCREEIVHNIEEFAREHKIAVDNYDVWESVEMDYTAHAKKIVDVYIKHIVPLLPA